MSADADPSAPGTSAAAGPSAQGPAAPRESAPDRLPRSISSLIFIRDRGVIVLWIALIVLFSIWAHPYFLSVGNAVLVLNAGAISAIFAAAIAMGVFSGALDLSVPGVAAFNAMVAAWLITHDYPVWLAIVVALALGVAIGTANARITLMGLNPALWSEADIRFQVSRDWLGSARTRTSTLHGPGPSMSTRGFCFRTSPSRSGRSTVSPRRSSSWPRCSSS